MFTSLLSPDSDHVMIPLGWLQLLCSYILPCTQLTECDKLYNCNHPKESSQSELGGNMQGCKHVSRICLFTVLLRIVINKKKIRRLILGVETYET